MTYDNGDTYNGPWFKGLRHGISGTMTYTTGDSYTGRWEMDEPHGMGVYTWVPGGTSADGRVCSVRASGCSAASSMLPGSSGSRPIGFDRLSVLRSSAAGRKHTHNFSCRNVCACY